VASQWTIGRRAWTLCSSHHCTWTVVVVSTYVDSRVAIYVVIS